MTQKELLYLEDAISHEGSIISIINHSIDSLDDDNLISFFKEELDNHVQIKNELMNMLGGKANE